MPAKKDYAVGRGKPPVHSQFRKGQSGNPGGKPARPEPSSSACEKLRGCTGREFYSLTHSDPETSLEKIANEIVVGAALGQPRALKTVLELTDKYIPDRFAGRIGRKNSPPEDTSAGGAQGRQTQVVTLSQGKSQGSFENETRADAITQSEQEVDATPAPSSGNASGMQNAPSTDEPDIAATRPKRPTIMIAGRIVQQGD